MKFKLTYFVHGTGLHFETDSIASLYEATCSVIKREKEASFPDADDAFCHYLQICADLASGKTIKHENHVFRLERLNAE